MTSPVTDPLGLAAGLGDIALAAVSFVQQRHQRLTTWEFSIASQPGPWNYLVFAGLGTLLEQLQSYHFSAEQIEYLRYHPALAGIPLAWFDHLATLQFEGALWAMKEGTVFFAPAPVLRITAPFDIGVLINSLVTNTLCHQIQVASKVSRLLTAAEGRMLIDQSHPFAMDNASALATTRAAYVAGILTTTFAEAARQFQLPSHVLMPYAWPMLNPDEVEAFHRYGSTFTTMSIPVVDTYETLTGIKHAIASGIPLHAIRLDGSELVEQSIEARRMLDQAGRKHVKILASGELDEERIAKLLAQRAAIDGFIVSAALVKSSDTSLLRGVYKLVAHQEADSSWEPGYQLSTGRRSYPWAKQVYRRTTDDGSFAGDIIAREAEEHPGEALLLSVLDQGKVAARQQSLEEARDYSMMQRVRLPMELLDLTATKQMYPIQYSETLEAEMAHLALRHRA